MPKCVDCGGFVADSAKTCPHCGSEVPHGIGGRARCPEDDDPFALAAQWVILLGLTSLPFFGIFLLGLTFLGLVIGDDFMTDWYSATVLIASLVLGIGWGQVLKREPSQEAKTACGIIAAVIILVVFALALVASNRRQRDELRQESADRPPPSTETSRWLVTFSAPVNGLALVASNYVISDKQSGAVIPVYQVNTRPSDCEVELITGPTPGWNARNFNLRIERFGRMARDTNGPPMEATAKIKDF